MKKRILPKSNILSVAGLILIIFFSLQVKASHTFTSNGGGSWSFSGTWTRASGGSGSQTHPVAGDAVIIQNDDIVTVDVTSACATVQIGVRSNGGGTLAFNTGKALTISGSLTLGATSSGGSTTSSGLLTMASGSSLTAGSIVNGTTFSGTIDMSSGGTLAANTITSGSGTATYDFSSGTVIYGSGSSTSGNIVPLTYNNLTITGGTYSVTSATTVKGTVTITSGTLAASTFLNIQGNFTNNANFTGTATFNGSAAQSILSANSTFPTLTINNSVGVTLADDVTVSGNLTGTGKLAGSAHTLTVGGNMTGITYTAGTSTVILNSNTTQNLGGNTFYNLTVSSGNSTTLTGAATVNNVLNFTSGLLVLGSNKLTIGTSGSISGYGTSNYVQTNGTGLLEMTATTSGTLFPIGDSYNPITIQPGTTNAIYDAGVSNGITDASGAAISSHVVNRTWVVLPVSGSTQNVTITPQWVTGDELGYTSFFIVNFSYIASRTTNPTGAWTPESSSGFAGFGPYTISSNAMSMAPATTYYFGVGDFTNTALPVTLVSFNAKYENNQVNLDWSTASEINNHYFNIQRSIDGQTWATIGQVEGHGNSTTIQNYFATDNLAGIIPAGDIYYRLEQVDYNGTSTYSMIRSVNINIANTFNITVYPNPASDLININWTNTGQNVSALKIVSINGETVYSENAIGLGPVSKQINIANYPTGTYYVEVLSGKTVNTVLFVKN